MTTWIFLRGLLRDSRHWGQFVPEFRATFALDRVITLDLPGNGLCNAQASPWSVAAMVEAYRAQLQHKGIAGPYCILAVSMGAMVCAQWAQRYPHEVQMQVLINTSMRPFSPVYQRLRLGQAVAFAKLLLCGASPAEWERAILRATSSRVNDTVLEAWCGYRKTHPVSVGNGVRQLMAAARYCASHTAPDVPTLVLASQQDRLVDVQCSKDLAQAWRVPMALHPDAGHDLTLDDATWVIEKIVAWLRVHKASADLS